MPEKHSFESMATDIWLRSKKKNDHVTSIRKE